MLGDLIIDMQCYATSRPLAHAHAFGLSPAKTFGDMWLANGRQAQQE
jgi:hypothetical protein